MHITRRAALQKLLALGLIAPTAALYRPAVAAAQGLWPPVWFWDGIGVKLRRDAVSLWQFENGASLGLDSSNYGNNLTNNNAVSQTTGKVGQAAQFVAASSQSLSIADNDALSVDTTDAAWAFWFQATTLGTRTLLSKYGGAGQREYVFYTFSSKLNLDASDDGTATVTVTEPTNLSTGTWYFVYAQYRRATKQTALSINQAALTTSSALTTAGLKNGTQPFKLGGPDGAAYWDGLLDQVGFWKRLLSAQERAYLWNGGAGRAL